MIIGNSLMSPYFLDVFNLADATHNFSEKAIIALAMALLILMREIDLSVAAIVALVALCIGLLAGAGYGVPVLVLAGLGDRAHLRRVQRPPRHRVPGCHPSSSPSAPCRCIGASPK